MIIDITSQSDLDNYLRLKEGYIVNKTNSKEAKAHDLAHFCESKLKYCPKEYPKFWADTFPAAETEAQMRWSGVSCSPCENCKRTV